MGIRANRRKRREDEMRAKNTGLPGGKTIFPCWFVHNLCRDCENNKKGPFDRRGEDDIIVDVCGKNHRKNLYSVRAHLVEGAPFVVSNFPTISVPEDEYGFKTQRRNAGGCTVEEKCPYMVLMLMDADIDRMYDF